MTDEEDLRKQVEKQSKRKEDEEGREESEEKRKRRRERETRDGITVPQICFLRAER